MRLSRYLLLCLSLILLVGCDQGGDVSQKDPADTTEPAAADPAATDPAPADPSSDPAPTDPETEPAATDPAPADPAAEPAATDPAPTEEPAAPTANDLRGEIIGAARNGDFEKALELSTAALEKFPKNEELLTIGMQMAYIHGEQTWQAGEKEQAARLFHDTQGMVNRLIEMKEGKVEDPNLRGFVAQVRLREAMGQALQSKNDEALVALKSAIEFGLEDLGELAAAEDFQAFRDSEGFKALDKELAEARIAAIKRDLESFESFAFDFALPSVTEAEKQIALSEMKGKVVIADIWGTWCPPCRAEIPHFIELYKKHKDAGLEIVGINYERSTSNDDEARELITKFMDENEMNYACVLGDDKTLEQVKNFRGYPTTLFIDRGGKVRMMLVGLQPLAKLEAIAEVLLAEAAPPADEAAKEAPAKEAPAKEAPAEEAAKEAPAKEAPAEEAAKEAPAKE